MALGDAVREIREEKGLSQRALARLSGVHKNSIWALEANVSLGRVSTLLSICRALAIGPASLFERAYPAIPDNIAPDNPSES